MMRRIFAFMFLFTLSLVAYAFGADAVAPVVAAPSFMAWMQAHTTEIFGLALIISEFLALIPGFQGNGILDTIIKALRVLSGKQGEIQ